MLHTICYQEMSIGQECCSTSLRREEKEKILLYFKCLKPLGAGCGTVKRFMEMLQIFSSEMQDRHIRGSRWSNVFWTQLKDIVFPPSVLFSEISWDFKMP